MAYIISGVVSLDLGEDLPDDQVTSSLIQAIAEALDVHPRDVTLTIDPDTGDVVYEISADTAERASELQSSLQYPQVANEIQSQVTDLLETEVELGITSDYGVSARVELIVDSTNTDDIETSMEELNNALENDWDVVQEHVIITSVPTRAPSAQPSMMPTTLLPTSQPSITGLVVTVEVIQMKLQT